MKTHILLSSIMVASLVLVAPRLPYGDINPADVQDFAAKDTNRLRGQVIRAVVQASPYTDILEGGVLESNTSDVQRTVVQERAVLNQSLVRPAFVNDTAVCGTTGNAAEVGSTEYTMRLGTLRGKGPLVCIKGMWSSFKTSYTAAEGSLKQAVVQVINADVRSNLVDRSGCKVVLQAGPDFYRMFEGNMQAIDTAFPNIGLPNAAPNIDFLQYLSQFMREVLLVETWDEKGGDMNMRCIGSQEIINVLRNDAQVREDHRYLAAGTYDLGKVQLTRYRWEGPYRGLTFGVDPQPLRFNVYNSNAQPVYIEPEIAVETDNGVVARPNPAWVRAKYEIMLMIGRNSFRKLAPETYTGEGTFKFPAQGVTGELMWHNVRDNDQNVWQDFGRHYYQITRAYNPIRPHHVCAIAFSRNTVNFNLSVISGHGDFSATGSL